MPVQIQWTDAMDAQLLSLHRSGVRWDDIATELRVGRNSAIERIRRLGIRPVRSHEAHAAAITTETEACERDVSPLPAFHPISWGVLAALTPSIDPAPPGRHA